MTVAGNGSDGSTGDGGPAVAATIGGVQGLAVDSQGNVYFADTWNHRVRRVSTAGVISTFAGTGTGGDTGDGGPAASANLLWPSAVALDAAGNLYIASASRVRIVSAGGQIAAFAGGATPGYAGDGGPATSALLSGPRGLAVDSAGNVYIADSGNFRIRMVAKTGRISTVAGTGVSGYSGDRGPAVSAQIGFVYALALDNKDVLYFSDAYNHCVRRILASGTVETAAGGAFGSGGDGGAAGRAQLEYPQGLAVDRAGNLYVADLLNHRVRIIGADGTVFTAAGTGSPGFSGDGGTGPYAALNMPAALALAPGGDLYIADSRNFRIRRLRSPQAPPQPAVAGNPGAVNSASFSGAAPGALVTIFGRNLARGTAAAPAIPLPTSLGGATVLVNGTPAPLLYVSSSQINFQMPFMTPGAASLTVQRDGIASATLRAAIKISAPGIFTLPDNQGVILNEDYSMNGPGHPAKRGKPMMIWATGAGAVSPPVSAGQAAPFNPLASTPQKPRVTVGGAGASVQFSGLTPGLAGLWQINAVLPLSAPTGDAVPVSITLGGSQSKTVTMAVAP